MKNVAQPSKVRTRAKVNVMAGGGHAVWESDLGPMTRRVGSAYQEGAVQNLSTLTFSGSANVTYKKREGGAGARRRRRKWVKRRQDSATVKKPWEGTDEEKSNRNTV